MGSALIIVIGAPGKAEGELVVGTLNSGPHLGVQTWGVSGVVMLKTAIPSSRPWTSGALPLQGLWLSEPADPSYCQQSLRNEI